MSRNSFLSLAAVITLGGSPVMWAQNANILPLGSAIKFGGTNAPDTYSDPSTFGPTPVLVDGGKVRIWQEQIPTGSNGEWAIFHMQTVNGGPLANNLNANWNILVDYNLRVPASFDAAVNQWLVNGRPATSLSNFGSFCCAVLSNPILPGPAYYNTGFNGLLAAGLQANWQQIFINPYSFGNSGGIPTATANEFTFGLHFTLRPAASPTITQVISAGAFGAFTSFAPGSWIEIYGSNFAVGTQVWAGGDFDGANAPTKVGGVSVSIGGRPAYVNYVSPTQVNVQVPSGVGPGPQTLTVTNPTGTSAAFSVNVESVKPGLLAPSSFTVGGALNVVALFPDNTTYVLPPGAIAGVASRRARPGETITLYGIGFGSVTPNIAPGVLAQQLSTLATPLVVNFGGTQAAVSYAGLAPNFVGLYQFNVVVPSVAPNDRVPLTFTLGGAGGTQSLFIAVGN
ncbi:MAG: IPT/TIG domain-containing protein [Acidobacteriota bacterium]